MASKLYWKSLKAKLRGLDMASEGVDRKTYAEIALDGTMQDIQKHMKKKGYKIWNLPGIDFEAKKPGVSIIFSEDLGGADWVAYARKSQL